MRSNTLAAFAVGAVAVVAAAGCGSSSNNSSSAGNGGGLYGGGGSTKSTAAPPSGGSSAAAVVSVANNPKLGQILVDSKGFTLYYFKKDKKGGPSTCNGACASVWPPFTSSGTPTGQKGASASKLGTVMRNDGSEQVTYAGWPLYTYTPDTKPGETTGNDVTSFGAQWYAITPAGTEPTKGG
jgi:predicted lipoprotein with Yx(FWY)xxD motif